jgi:GNAT superfamily N-acetyltransferase
VTAICTSKIDVRLAGEADIPEIVRVTNIAYKVGEFCIRGDRTDLDDVFARMQEGSFLVVDDPRNPSVLLGAIYLSIAIGRAYFGTLAVEPQHQGTGMARALIEAAEDRCRSAGCRFVDLTVVNLRRELFPFYARLGYAASDVKPFPRPETVIKPLHLIQLTKPLRPTEDL